MTTKVLRKVAELTDLGGKAMATTPLRPWVQEEIDDGNLTARAVKCGPLGLSTGEMFLALTDAGRGKLKGSNVQIEAPSRPLAKVASNDGLAGTVPPAPTFDKERGQGART